MFVAYRANDGQPWILPIVRDIEQSLANDDKLKKDYLPPLGLKEFCTASVKFLLGDDNKAVRENRSLGIQSVSGSGAFLLGGMFLARVLGCKIFYNSKPGWAFCQSIFSTAGFEEGREYRYYSESKHELDMIGLLEDLNKAPEKSVIILQSCGHKPTGCDPTREQWIQLADVIEKRKLIPFFDTAHQGFISDLETDVWCVRYFADRGIEFLCSQSFSKNLLLFDERIGTLVFVTKDECAIPKIKQHVIRLLRGLYVCPPGHGARIVTRILMDPIMMEEWKKFIQTLSSKLKIVRKMLREHLEKLNTPGDWSYITTHCGLYLITGLNDKQAQYMVKQHHVYMSSSGQVILNGLLPTSVEYVAKAMHDTLAKIK